MKLFFFSFSLNFLIYKICLHYFNKLEKNKTLISYFPAHFPWHNQTLESGKCFPTYFPLHYQTSENNLLSRNSLFKRKLLSSKQMEPKWNILFHLTFFLKYGTMLFQRDSSILLSFFIWFLEFFFNFWWISTFFSIFCSILFEVALKWSLNFSIFSNSIIDFSIFNYLVNFNIFSPNSITGCI